MGVDDLQAGGLADDTVTVTEIREQLRPVDHFAGAQSVDLFVRSDDDIEGLPQIASCETAGRTDRGRQRALHVTGAPAVEFSAVLSDLKGVAGPVVGGPGRYHVVVAHEGQPALLRSTEAGDDGELGHAGGVGVGQHLDLEAKSSQDLGQVTGNRHIGGPTDGFVLYELGGEFQNIDVHNCTLPLSIGRGRR